MINKYTDEQLADNKLICEFLGCKVDVSFQNREGDFRYHSVKGKLVEKWREELFGVGGYEQSMLLTNTRFHNDWNWLNVVMEKIVDLKYSIEILHENWDGKHMFIVKIYDGRQMVKHKKPRYNNSSDGFDNISNGRSKIETTYVEIVKFIKWYKTQK